MTPAKTYIMAECTLVNGCNMLNVGKLTLKITLWVGLIFQLIFTVKYSRQV